jgi:serine palmitoyltransferase
MFTFLMQHCSYVKFFVNFADVHLRLEDKLEQFMKTEEAILYSYGFATIASAIPAYSKRGDVIFADEGVHFAIQKGIQASRSKVVYFKHNDLDDLERVLKLQQVEDKKNPKKAKVTRRFLVIEGVYMNSGDICPLPQLVELKHKYKVRIFMDESVSFGTFGKTGKGVTEHFGVPIEEVDLIAGSLENAIASVGGFCCGKAFVIDHQRLSGLGYCFSASAPPMLAQAAITALEVLEDNPDMLVKLHDLCEYMHSKLQQLTGMRLSGDPISPVKHLYLATRSGDRGSDTGKLRQIVTKAEEKGIALTVAAYLDEEVHSPEPSIRIPVCSELKYEDIDNLVEILDNVTKQVL